MSETLLAVVIGGIIGSFSTLASTLISTLTQNRTWKLEKRLEHLRAQRDTLEERSTELLIKLSEGMAENRYDIPMISELLVRMPQPVIERFRGWMAEQNKDEEVAKFAFMDICTEIKKALREIDEQIEKMINV